MVVRETIPESSPTSNGGRFFLVFLDAEQDVVGFGFGLINVEGIVRRNSPNSVGLAKTKKDFVDDVFFWQPMAVDLGIKILSELLFVPEEGLFRLLFAHVEDERRNFAIQTSRGTHHAFAVGS